MNTKMNTKALANILLITRAPNNLSSTSTANEHNNRSKIPVLFTTQNPRQSSSSLSSQPPRSIESSVGTCTVCRRDGIRLINTTGLLWNHGPRENPCAGSHTPPQFGSIHVAAPVSLTKQTPSAPSAEETQDGNIPLLPSQISSSLMQPVVPDTDTHPNLI